MNKFEGKVAIVTGGSMGIGLATARRFVSEGAFVYITGRRKTELDAAVSSIGKNVTAVQGDVSHLEDLDRLYATVEQQHGHFDILFANAGVEGTVPLGDITEAFFEHIFSINVKGLLFSVQKGLPLLRDGSSIILNSSIAALKGREGNSVYAASKAAIRSFARSWTMDLRDRHIRVNVVTPGPINTEAVRNAPLDEVQREQQEQRIKNAIPMGRRGDPDEVARAVSFLASDESSFITGIELFVDGGMAQV
jgi:NAD(P)-dependent dehydrogenase (short-subunit alcohol dehydrogenase family)